MWPITIGSLTTAVKFDTGFNDTDGQFAAAAVDTGGAPCKANIFKKIWKMKMALPRLCIYRVRWKMIQVNNLLKLFLSQETTSETFLFYYSSFAQVDICHLKKDSTERSAIERWAVRNDSAYLVLFVNNYSQVDLIC